MKFTSSIYNNKCKNRQYKRENMGSKANKSIQKEFKSLRRKLLDLSMRNQLLNFRPRSRTIEVVNDTPSHIYDYLVLNEKKMQFLPQRDEKELERELEKEAEEKRELPEDLSDENSAILESMVENLKIAKVDTIVKDEDNTEDKDSDLWEFPPIDEETVEEQKNRFLETELTPSELQRRLFYINQRARTMLQEQGYNILYLGLGFLEWDEPHVPDIRKAPLVLIPVIIERRKVGMSFSIHWDGNDILTNISLQAKLKEQDIELPEFSMPANAEDIKKYLKKVKKATKSMKGWKVHDEIQLGFFSFTKFVMYRDLDPATYKETIDITEKPLISAIFNPDLAKERYNFMESEVDERLKYKDVYHVMDADSSQIAAIEDVKAGSNLVVEGPPGTGKSQTIVNLIAELMANDKTILFVSEKMAALEVVKSRLDRIGLGKFCLELHSHKTRKKDVLQELESSLKDMQEEELDIDRQLNRLETLRKQLNEYNRALHQPLYKIRLSPFQLFGMKESAEKKFPEIPVVRIPSPEDITPEQWEESIIELENLTRLSELLPPLAENPWSGTDPGMILPPTIREIEQQIIETQDNLDLFRKKVKAFEEEYGIKNSKNFYELDKTILASQILSESKPIDLEILNSPVWDEHENDAFLLLEKLEKLQKSITILERFHDSVLEKDLDKLLRDYLEHSSSKIKFLSGKYRKIKNEIDSLYLKNPPQNDYEIIQDLESLKDLTNLKNQLHEHEEVARKFFGSHWNLENSSVKELTATARWMVQFRKLANDNIITDKTMELVFSGIDHEKITQMENELLAENDYFSKSLESLKSTLNTHSHIIFNKEPQMVTFSQWKTKLRLWKDNLSILPLWSQYLEKKKLCMKTKAAPFIPSVESGAIALDDVKDIMEGNLADSLLSMAFKEISILYTFIGDLHQGRITEFQELDSKIIELNRKRLFNKLNHNMPQVFGGAAPNSEANVLSGEFTRKRGHLPLRKLLAKSGGLIQQIKPCFMMSPLSIAQYLDPANEKLEFDVVIFDEASQVKPEDALGAFLRGKTAVVMGDTNQLPPTSFFDQMIISEEETEEVARAADMESILHLCKRSFQVKMLRWHYRSRHESLIAVSNQEFYDNYLLVYPSPCHESEELGLKLNYLPETVYERGRGSFNPVEAKEVVKEIFNHFRKYKGTKSLGVGTFSVAQMNAILEELELMRKEHPKMERYFREDADEHFFVKNLETIQGDERDVIFISIGYGFDENQKISMNFGPLNQEGGERRLNVLITRAREKCVAFSNFRSMDLHVTGGTPFGVKALKTFLQYAENGSLSLEKGTNDEIQSPFEESVYQFLEEHGLEVERSIGCAGFRVDMAIVDPEDHGRYMVGIECDGAMYHSSAVARDRDRLREQVLEGLGWKIIHVWSTDWYRNREETQKKLLNAIGVIEIETTTELEKESEELNDLAGNLEEIDESINLETQDIETESESLEVSREELDESEMARGELAEESVDEKSENEVLMENGIKLSSSELDSSFEVQSSYAPPEDIVSKNIDAEDIPSEDIVSENSDITGNVKISDHNSSIDSDAEVIPSSDLDMDQPLSNETDLDESNLQTEETDPEHSKQLTPSSPPKLEDKLVPYQSYESTTLTTSDELYKSPTPVVSTVVSEIVSIEGPIHYEEIIRRIREGCGLRRAGNKVRNIISSAVEMAENNGNIRRSGDFLLLNDTSNVPVRERIYKPNITFISAEEIEEAIRMVLDFESMTPERELVIKTSRLFGFKTTSKKTFDRINGVLRDMIDKGVLKEFNGKIDFNR
jgi:superfamily I DNA and/or RNA helicase